MYYQLQVIVTFTQMLSLSRYVKILALLALTEYYNDQLMGAFQLLYVAFSNLGHYFDFLSLSKGVQVLDL